MLLLMRMVKMAMVMQMMRLLMISFTLRPTKLGKKKDDMSFDDVRLSFIIMISLSTKCDNSNAKPNVIQMQIRNDAMTSLILLRTTTTTW